MEEGMGATVLKSNLIFLIFFKLKNEHGSSGTVSIRPKKHIVEKLNTILKFTIICCFLDLLLALPHMQQIYRTTTMPKLDLIKLQRQTWKFFSKFVAYFQSTFS